MIYILFILFTLLVLSLAFYQWQYYMIFSPVFYREESLFDECSILSIEADDKIALEGAIYEPKNATNTLLVFVGRSHDAVGLINRLSLTYQNSRVITFNYRSYGKSGGVINEKNLLSDAVKIASLVQKNYGNFYLLGFSLGSNLVSYVASKQKTKGIFLVGAFESIASLAKLKFGLNVAPLLRYKFRTGEYIQTVDADTYLFASRSDETTYIENSRALKEKVKNLKEYVELDNLTHKELLWDKVVTDKINRLINS